MLNRFSKEVYGKGFRYIGVDEDFFHGHVLFEKRQESGKDVLYMRAILYHTQEEAHKAHWDKTVDSKYDYLDVTTRNWIQWFSDDSHQDGAHIENARKYLDIKAKDPKQFYEEVPPQKDLFYTIHSKNLDGEKLGFKVFAELSLNFHLEPCGGIPDNVYGYIQGPIQVGVGAESACVGLLTPNPLLEVDLLRR